MQAFREAVERKDLDGLIALFAEDAVFRSPAVHRPYEGRDTIRVLLGAVLEVFEDFRYTDELAGGDGRSALVFRARAGDRELEGCDFIHVRDDGLVDELVVMIRPHTGLQAVMEAMGRILSRPPPRSAPA